jgi:hypothetical protein
MKTYRVFSRVTWQVARSGNWPGGLEPLACPPEECPTIDTGCDFDEAVAICDEHNDERGREPGLEPFYEFTAE